MTQTLILASNNAGKLREFASLLEPLGLNVETQGAHGVPEAEEPHQTFVENALEKARHASRLTGLPALADDSGVCVNALGGAPGVLSARYAGEPKSDARNNAKLIDDLAPHADKSAYYYCVLVYVRHADAGNLENAKEFLEADFTRTVGSAAIVLAAFSLCLVKIRRLRVTVPRSFAVLPLLGLALIYAAVRLYFGSWSLVAMNDRTSPFGIFSQTYLTVGLTQEELRLRKRAESFEFSASRRADPAGSETYVLVVGESARRHDFGLYGYGRDTTPLLSKTSNLLAFRDVVTQDAQTKVSVPLILTRGSIENQQRAAREKSIITLFHDVGFRTYWLSSQQREIRMAAVGHYSDEADVVRFFERQHDIVLINAMREILTKEGDRPQKRFFVLHTLGSHFNLTSRYPREFARYPDGISAGINGSSSLMNVYQYSKASSRTNHAELVNAYDNSIVYTDYVLSQLIVLLRERPGPSAMLYVSDHGDNLRDDGRNLFGHAHNNEYDLPIPLLFWYSDDYARQFPDNIATARLNLTHPLTTRSVFYSLAQMAAISMNDQDLSRLSVFSADLNHYRRMVGQPTPFDFDEWLARTGTTIPAGKVPQ